MRSMDRSYCSTEGYLLAYVGPPPRRPCLTVELRNKWYHLYAVYPDGVARQVSYHEYEALECDLQVTHLWSDHVPYPPALRAIATHLDMDWDEISLDMVHGRYYREVMDLLDEDDPMDWIKNRVVREDDRHAARRSRRAADLG